MAARGGGVHAGRISKDLINAEGAATIIVRDRAIEDGDDLIDKADDVEHENDVVRMTFVMAIERRCAEGNDDLVFREGFIEGAESVLALEPAL